MLKLKRKSVLIKRVECLGDVICTEPIVRYFYNRKYNVHFEAGKYKDVYVNNNMVSLEKKPCDEFYDLTGIYEKRLHLSIIDGYLDYLRIKLPEEDKHPRLYISEQEQLYFEDLKKQFDLNKYAVLSIGYIGGALRRGFWSPVHWLPIVEKLINSNYKVLQVGNLARKNIKDDEFPKLSNLIDLRYKTNIRQLFTLVKNANLFVGMDGGVMHTANAFDIPGIAIFNTCHPREKLISKNSTVVGPSACANQQFPLKEMLNHLNRFVING